MLLVGGGLEGFCSLIAWFLLDNGAVAKAHHGQSVFGAHFAMERFQDFQLIIGGLGGHGFAAIDQDHHRALLILQLHGRLGHGQDQEEDDDKPHEVKAPRGQSPQVHCGSQR